MPTNSKTLLTEWPKINPGIQNIEVPGENLLIILPVISEVSGSFGKPPKSLYASFSKLMSWSKIIDFV